MTAISPIPSSHFLSIPPSFDAGPSTSSRNSNGAAPNTASLASADFEVDVRTGFLPATPNVTRLPLFYELWETALDAASNGPHRLTLGGGTDRDRRWRNGIELMATLSTDHLTTLPLLRRAHLVLAFLTHFYVHTAESVDNHPLVIPAPLSIPLAKVSLMVGLPPILTYADTVLFNFESADPKAALTMANPPTRALATFTGTSSEEQFYIISALCEIAGAEALKIMRQSLDEVFLGDEIALRRLTRYLRKLAIQIDRIGDITLSIMQGVDPEEFYHLIRPWFRGGDADGPGSKGWVYNGAGNIGLDGENVERQPTQGRLFSGPSAGQSSLIHAIDIFLTVDHTEQDEGGDSSVQGSRNESTFLQRMLQYMPGPHRTFLLHLADSPTPLRPLVVHHASTHPHLAEAYDSALEALKRFREKHMRIASLYIIQQARRPPSARIRRLLRKEEEADIAADPEELRGTGGTPLFRFLKRCRDNTTRAQLASR